MSSSVGEPQWAWLGLLKWSLSYSDGTRPSDESMKEMSAEDKKFLEEVMKNGIVDEAERMKEILQTMAQSLDKYQSRNGDDVNLDELLDLLQELRDIVEQIDYARAFVSLKGLPFLLGCLQQRDAIPQPLRQACLGIWSTLCQNNPPVQLALLELGSIKILSDLFFLETDSKYKAKLVQAMSANIRNHATAEEVFTQVEQSTELIKQGLLLTEANGYTLPTRTLFFLRALVTSDNSSRSRVRQFANCIGYVSDNYLSSSALTNPELRELALELLTTVLEQKLSVNIFLENGRKQRIAGLGVRSITALRQLTGEEREFATMELELWEKLIVQLARVEADEEGNSEPLLLAAGEPLPETLPQ